MSKSEDDSVTGQALAPYLCHTAESAMDGYDVVRSTGEIVLTFPTEDLAIVVALTLNAGYSSLYDKGWCRGYDVGQQAAEELASCGYQPDGAVELGDPPGDE